jgi:hypothetical protein
MKVTIFFVLIFLCSGVYAVSGVNPASYEVDFEPGYSGNFEFNFFLGEGVKTSLSIEGELAEYVSLNKKRISGSELVIAELNLPSEISSPGLNYIKIKADELNVVAVIKVNVPYPDRYVEMELSVPNKNVNEIVDIELTVFNRGDESIFIEPVIWVLEGEDVVDSFALDKNYLYINMTRKFNVSFNSSGYSAGDYLVVANLDYGEGVAHAENPFKLGELYVEILDYSRRFMENKIAKFDIAVESFWADDIDEVYAEVNILGFENASFVTDSVELGAWKSTITSGIFDATLVSGYDLEAEIVLHYGDKSISENVELKIIKGVDYVLYGVIAIGVIILGLLVWRGSVFTKKLKKQSLVRKK